MDNDDQKSRIINGNRCIEGWREHEIEFTSIHRSQREQCEQRGGRNNRHVRQYFKYTEPRRMKALIIPVEGKKDEHVPSRMRTRRD